MQALPTIRQPVLLHEDARVRTLFLHESHVLGRLAKTLIRENQSIILIHRVDSLCRFPVNLVDRGADAALGHFVSDCATVLRHDRLVEQVRGGDILFGQVCIVPVKEVRKCPLSRAGHRLRDRAQGPNCL